MEEKNNKTAIIGVRTTKEEKALLIAIASKKGMKLSKMVRGVLEAVAENPGVIDIFLEGERERKRNFLIEGEGKEKKKKSKVSNDDIRDYIYGKVGEGGAISVNVIYANLLSYISDRRYAKQKLMSALQPEVIKGNVEINGNMIRVLRRPDREISMWG